MASPPAHAAGTSGLKLKLSSQKHRHPDPSPTPSNSTAAASIAVGSNIDFSLPSQPQRPLVPLRPGVQKPPKPGPKRQAEVNEDFSNTKAPSQVAFPTFWSGVEPYLREIREDDLALLNFKVSQMRGHLTELTDRPRLLSHTRFRPKGATIPRYGTKRMACRSVLPLEFRYLVCDTLLPRGAARPHLTLFLPQK